MEVSFTIASVSGGIQLLQSGVFFGFFCFGLLWVFFSVFLFFSFLWIFLVLGDLLVL